MSRMPELDVGGLRQAYFNSAPIRPQIDVDAFLALYRAGALTDVTRIRSVAYRTDGTVDVVTDDDQVWVVEVFDRPHEMKWRARRDHAATGRRIGRRIAREAMPRTVMSDDLVDLRVHAELRLFGVARRVPRTWLLNVPMLQVAGRGLCMMHERALCVVHPQLIDPARYFYDIRITRIANPQKDRT